MHLGALFALEVVDQPSRGVSRDSVNDVVNVRFTPFAGVFTRKSSRESVNISVKRVYSLSCGEEHPQKPKIGHLGLMQKGIMQFALSQFALST